MQTGTANRIALDDGSDGFDRAALTLGDNNRIVVTQTADDNQAWIDVM